MKGSENNPKTVVCFDFDQTIVNGHLHGALKNQGLEGIGAYGQDRLFVDSKPVNPDGFVNSEYNAQAVASAAMNPKVYGGLKGGKQLKTTFQTMLEQGHEIVITSNTQYPDGIKAVLANECEFTKEQLDKIVIVGGFPSDGADNNPSGKNEHLAKVMEMKGITDPKNIILVDDSPNNIRAANEKGIRTIPVSKDACPPAEATHLDRLVEEATKMRAEAIDKSQAASIEQRPQRAVSAPTALKPLASPPAPPPPSIKPASPTPAPQKQEMQQQAKPRALDKKEQKLVRKMVDKELTNLEKASGMGVIKRFQNRKVHTAALNDRSNRLIQSANIAGTEIGQIAQYNKKGLETIVKQSINGPDQTAGLQRIQNNHKGINDFLKAVDPKAQERFADNSSNIFPSKRFADRAAAAFVKIDTNIGAANTTNIARFAEAYVNANGKDGQPSKFPKDFIDNPKLHNTLVRAATADPRITADVIKEMKGKDVVNLNKPKDFDKVFTPVVNAVATSGKLESANTTIDLINSDAKRTGVTAAVRGDLDYKKVDAITRGAQPNGEVNKPIDSMSKNERLQQSAHIAATYPNVHKLAEEALKEQSKTSGKEGKATNRDICKFAEGLQNQGVDLKALDSKIGADPKFKQDFKETLTQKSETIKIDKAQEKQINTANKENTSIEKDPRRAIKPDNIQKVKNHTVIDSIMNKQNKSFGRDIEKLSSQLRSEMKPASKSANTPSSLTVNTAAKTSGAHR
jgi:FMN phosphatase YigB (HAD superfamily)